MAKRHGIYAAVCAAGLLGCGSDALAPLPHEQALRCMSHVTCTIVAAEGECPEEPLETCDGVDNNCDGRIDEWDSTAGSACRSCRDWATCEIYSSGVECPAAPLEICDGIDNDCDGAIDDLACDTCLDYGTCTTYSSTGPCPAPPPEVCDGVDNNCNGRVDESDPIAGDNCQPGNACLVGVLACVGGELACQSVTDPSSLACTPGTVEMDDSCGDCAQRERICQSDCTWGAWSPCITPALGHACQSGDPGFPARGSSCGGFVTCVDGDVICSCASDDNDCDGIVDAIDNDDDDDGIVDGSDDFPLEIQVRDFTIDFDRIPHGGTLSDQYADFGVTFSGGFHVADTTLNDWAACYVNEIPQRVLCGHAAAGGTGSLCSGLAPEGAVWQNNCGQEEAVLHITFDRPASYASMMMRAGSACSNQDGDTALFRAFDVQGNTIGEDSAFAHTVPNPPLIPWQQQALGEGTALVSIRVDDIHSLTFDICDTDVTDTLRIVELAGACE